METNIESATLEKLKIGLLTMLSPEILQDAQVDFSRTIEDMIIVRVKGFIWGEQAKRQEVSFPKDWRQAIKERWAPRWFLARWPVRYTKIVMDAKVLYPDINISLPDERHFLHISKTRTTI